MVKVFCAVIGVGSVFPVDIDISETVGDLKDKIKEEKPNTVYFDADFLKLYLAKEGDTWLKTRDEAIKALKAKRFPDRIKDLMQEHLELDEGCRLNNADCFGDDFTPEESQVHVLVECPDDPEQVLKYRQQDETAGSIVDNWFSWRLPWSSLLSMFTAKEKRA